MDTTLIDIPDGCKDQRFSVLSYEQVNRLSDLMNEVIPIHGRGNFPTLEVKLCDLVSLVRTKLELDGINVKEIRLNGSGASTVLASDTCNISYNDLDLIFSLDLPSQKHYERVKLAVLDVLLDLLPEGTSKKRMSSCTLKEAYVSKMVKVNDSDRWSLIALGNNKMHSVELKFVDRMKRKYEFSVDSFHIMLDTLFLFYNCARMPITDNFYPTVVGESVYGNFNDALLHLHKKLIATKSPEEIRGGGLLKYCNLLVKNYRPAWPEQVKTMERYMCSRFFIDFPDLTGQHNKLCKFLDNHFQDGDMQLKYDYLMILYQVVDESTVCLMGHERRQTLDMILELASTVYQPPSPGQFSTGVQYSTGVQSDLCDNLTQAPGPGTISSGYCTPSTDGGSSAGHGTWSSASSTASSGTGSSGGWSQPGVGASHPGPGGRSSGCGSSVSSGQYSPMSTSSSCSPSLSPKPEQEPQPLCQPGPPVSQGLMPHKFSVPPPTHCAPAPCPPISQYQAPPPVSVCSAPPPAMLPPPVPAPCPPPAPVSHQTGPVPTYEFVTSCQPSVIYSNGYYYTSFTPPAPAPAPAPAAGTYYTSCGSCSCGAPAPGPQVMAPGPAHWTVSAPPPVAGS